MQGAQVADPEISRASYHRVVDSIAEPKLHVVRVCVGCSRPGERALGSAGVSGEEVAVPELGILWII